MTTNQFLRLLAIGLCVTYGVVIAIFAVLKAATPALDFIGWAEIVYGPAITVGCVFLLMAIGVRVECWIRGEGK
jgi:hypothetical protein